jgi:hypothetical protein
MPYIKGKIGKTSAPKVKDNIMTAAPDFALPLLVVLVPSASCWQERSQAPR